jgi:hypothetical protein
MAQPRCGEKDMALLVEKLEAHLDRAERDL